ncbi:hypothetical protein AB0O05_16275 [Streptomyces sp. NPDC093084]|uniref:hypothetical protein n=1 Tax=Streptomyces sp. NPDC093084 TaxID=3155197 RepID=UPI00341DEB29
MASPRLLAPIPQPRRNLFAVGKNYRDHVEDFGRSGYVDIPQLISTISAGITLHRGTPGDVVECAITGPGALRNTVSTQPKDAS